jgi:protein O-mannosyl-transferase
VFYPYPLSPYALWQAAAATTLLLIITVAVVLACRRRYLPVGWFWFLGTLVPMIGLVQVGTQAMADRYAYLSFVGLFIMVCWLVADWAQQTRVAPTFLPAVSVAALLALGVVAHRQVSFWNDHVTLWTHALEVTNNNWVAENNLGAALLKEAKVEEAIPHFRAAAALDPSDPNSNLNIGTYEQMHGNLPGAIEYYKKAVALARNPRTKAKAYNNLGYAYKEFGDLADARVCFQGAVQYDPEFVGAWIGLGLAAQRTGDLPLAINAYSRAVRLNPSDLGYLLLAQAFEQSGDREQSKAARHKAEALSQNIVTAQHSADQLLQR